MTAPHPTVHTFRADSTATGRFGIKLDGEEVATLALKEKNLSTGAGVKSGKASKTAILRRSETESVDRSCKEDVAPSVPHTYA